MIPQRARRFANPTRWSLHRLTRSVLRGLWHSDDHGTDLMTDDGSGLISSWKDLINLTNPTAATTARPTWGATAFDGTRSAVMFDGSANAMTTTSLPALPVGTDPGWVFVVGADDSAVDDATARNFVAYGTSTAGNGRYIVRELSPFVAGAPPALRMTAGTAPNWRSPAITTRFMAFMQFQADGQTIDGRLNGDPTTAGANPTAFNTSTTRLRFGSGVGSGVSSLCKGKIRTVVIGAGVLSLADRQRLEGFCAADSGLQSLLPVDHPYRSATP
jgi:hypothetical protein